MTQISSSVYFSIAKLLAAWIASNLSMNRDKVYAKNPLWLKDKIKKNSVYIFCLELLLQLAQQSPNSISQSLLSYMYPIFCVWRKAKLTTFHFKAREGLKVRPNNCP